MRVRVCVCFRRARCARCARCFVCARVRGACAHDGHGSNANTYSSSVRSHRRRGRSLRPRGAGFSLIKKSPPSSRRLKSTPSRGVTYSSNEALAQEPVHRWPVGPSSAAPAPASSSVGLGADWGAAPCAAWAWACGLPPSHHARIGDHAAMPGSGSSLSMAAIVVGAREHGAAYPCAILPRTALTTHEREPYLIKQLKNCKLFERSVRVSVPAPRTLHPAPPPQTLGSRRISSNENCNCELFETRTVLVISVSAPRTSRPPSLPRSVFERYGGQWQARMVLQCVSLSGQGHSGQAPGNQGERGIITSGWP